MSGTSRTRRLSRIFRPDGRSVIVALDHGLIDGPIAGWEDPAGTLSAIVAGGADAILTSYGVAGHYAAELAATGLILRADGAATSMGSPSDGPASVFFAVEEALRLGADAMVVTAVPGSDKEESSLRNLSSVTASAHRWGMPVLGEMVPGGFNSSAALRRAPQVSAAARLGAELGADFIKAPYCDGYDEVTSKTFVPVVILGGSKVSEEAMLTDIRNAIDAGAAGVAIGRNVFQSADPEAMTAAIVALVHGGVSVDAALALLAGG